MASATVAGHAITLDAGQVVALMASRNPEVIRTHYVIIDGRRFPPKQVLAAATGLDRADFTTHQARAFLKRLGFAVHRFVDGGGGLGAAASPLGPHGGAEAAGLRRYAGLWVAQRGLEVIFSAAEPSAVVDWLRTHGQAADAVFGVPASAAGSGSAMVQGE